MAEYTVGLRYGGGKRGRFIVMADREKVAVSSLVHRNVLSEKMF